MNKLNYWLYQQKLIWIGDYQNSIKSFKRMIDNFRYFNSETFSWSFLTSNIIRLIAVLSMFIDHTGFIVFPTMIGFRVFGRIAFPVYGFLVAIGSFYTHNLGRYCLRFLIFAILFQAALILGTFVIFPNNQGSGTFLDPFYLNIYFQLFLGALTIYIFKQNIYGGMLALIIFATLTGVIHNQLFRITGNFRLDIDYGSYGYLMIVGFYGALRLGRSTTGISQNAWVNFKFYGILVFSFLTIVFPLAGIISSFQIFALITVPFFVFYSPKRILKMRYLSWLFLSAYPMSFLIPFFSLL